MKSRLNAFIEKNKHAFLLLYFCIYFPWFHHLERTVTTHFHVIHTALDDLIPFCEYFIVPYLLWFGYVAWISYEGIKAIKKLKAEGVNVTATAVYDLMQAYMALAAGADYIAPYVNRIGNLGNDPMELINELSNRIVQDGYDCKILAASFKGVQQVRDAFNYGSQAITAPVEVLKQIFANPSIEKAVNDFNSDWYDVYGEGKGICDL